MGRSAASETDSADRGLDEETHEDVVDYPPDRPLVEWLKGFVRTAQLAAFLALVLVPLVGGFLVPLGPPAYHVEVAAVNPADTVAPETGRPFARLDAESATVFEQVLDDADNAIDFRPDRATDYPEDDRPWILEGETATVVFEDLAFRITVENRGPPLRFPAIILGVIVSALAVILGYRLTEWDPV